MTSRVRYIDSSFYFRDSEVKFIAKERLHRKRGGGVYEEAKKMEMETSGGLSSDSGDDVDDARNFGFC